MITEACCGLAGKRRMHESISFHPSLRNPKRTVKNCGLCAESAKGRLARDIPSDIWRNEVIHQEGCPMQLFVVEPRAHSCPGLIAVLPVLFIIYLHGPAPICWVLHGYWWGTAKITKEWPSDIFLFSAQWEWMICRLIPKPGTGKSSAACRSVYNPCNSSFRRSHALSWPPWAQHASGTHTGRGLQTKHKTKAKHPHR